MKALKMIAVTRAPSAGLVIVGMFWGGFAGLMPDIKAFAGASDAEFGLIMMLAALGSMGAMAIAPRVFVGLGRNVLPVAGVFLSIAFLGPTFADDLTGLALCILVMGACVGMMDICCNMRVSALEATHDASFMNYAHAMFSFGFGFTALCVAWAREAGFSLQEVLPVLCVLALFTTVVTIERRTKWFAPEDPPEGQGRKLSSVHKYVVVLTAVVLFSSFVGENATEAWSALHIERTLGADIGHGSYGPAVLGLVMGCARLLGQFAADKIGERALITGSAILGSLGAVVIAAAWSPTVVVIGVGVVAVGMAVIVPSANTVLGRRVPGHLRGLALSRAWMFGMTGFFVGPSVMGLIAEGFGLRVAYLTIALIIAATIPAARALGKVDVVEKP